MASSLIQLGEEREEGKYCGQACSTCKVMGVISALAQRGVRIHLIRAELGDLWFLLSFVGLHLCFEGLG